MGMMIMGRNVNGLPEEGGGTTGTSPYRAHPMSTVRLYIVDIVDRQIDR